MGFLLLSTKNCLRNLSILCLIFVSINNFEEIQSHRLSLPKEKVFNKNNLTGIASANTSDYDSREARRSGKKYQNRV